MKKALCLICHKPNSIWIEFLEKFINYDIYIIVDDNSTDYKNKYKTNVNIIQIPNDVCQKSGFIDMNFTIKKKISGWEKAIYYFVNNPQYEHIWFLEDDVFITSEQTLIDIDEKYIHSDLLTNSCSENKTGHKNDWNWKYIHIKIEPPYYHAMCCAIRVSKELISKIASYANNYNTLFFLEALFPTLCKRDNLIYDTPDELINIVYRKKYVLSDIDTKNLYHPIKDMNKQKRFRDSLTSNVQQ